MGFEIPKISNATFDKLVKEALKRIPQLSREWTDYNIHDPGITFVELLAYLVEMQLFYLDQVTESHYLKFLRLLGVEPRPALPSKTQITFDLSSDKAVKVESGTELAAKVDEDLILFLTIDSLIVVRTKLEQLVLSVMKLNERKDEDTKWFDPLTASEGFFYAFGENPMPQKETLYLGFNEKFPGEEEISLSVNLYEDDLPERGQHDEEPDIIPSAKAVWEYSRGDSWSKLKVIEDSTLSFSESGYVKFKPPTDFTSIDVFGDNGKKFFWLRCWLEQASFEIPPRIRSIKLNTVDAVQMKKFSGQAPITTTDRIPQRITELPNQVFNLKHAPVVPRQLIVRIKEREKWRKWIPVDSFEHSGREDAQFMIFHKVNNETGNIEGFIGFGDGKKGKKVPIGIKNIRVTSQIYDEPAEEEFFSGDNTPSQKFSLKKVPPILKDALVFTGANSEAWHPVQDFDASKPADRHFILNRNRGKIQLGTGDRGRIDSDVRIDAAIYYGTMAEKGNVKKNTNVEIVDINLQDNKNLTIAAFEDASGGRAAESLGGTILRARADLKKPYRAVTLEDFDYIAKATPGLRIARVKALWEKDIDTNQAVKVIVVPYRLPDSENLLKGASEGFKKTVCLHLDRHRLLTTRIEIVDPKYVEISVHATVKVKPLASAKNVRDRVVKELELLFHPLNGYAGSGWPFGKTVYRSMICAKIEKVEGVDCVHSLILIARGEAEYSGENLKIRENYSTFSGRHLIETVETQESCESECQ